MKENAIPLYSEKPFKQATIIFYFIGTLKPALSGVDSEKRLRWHLIHTRCFFFVHCCLVSYQSLALVLVLKSRHIL